MSKRHIDSRHPEVIKEILVRDSEHSTVYFVIGAYVALEDYNNLKSRLENLERKYKKLQRRHKQVGADLVCYKKAYNTVNDECENLHNKIVELEDAYELDIAYHINN